MKVLGVISTTALFLLLGVTVPVFAQDEGHDQDAKPAKQDDQAKPVKQEDKAMPAKQEDQAKTAKQDEQAKPDKPQPQAKQEEQAKSEKQDTQTKQVKQEGNAKTTGQQHAQRTPAEEQKQRAVPALRLSARGSGRIPDAQFSANFGEGHTFVINQPTIVGGFSRFQYGGFWFGFVQPWPVGWYYTDNVYVTFVDGSYYLCNPYYPGAQIALSVVI